MIVTDTRNLVLERGRLRVVLATVVINVVAVSLLTLASWSDWRTGAALNIVDNCLLVGFTLVRRDALLGRFLLFGIVVGFCELPADAWLVDYTGTLDYSLGGGPMIWRSPLWMPLAWGVWDCAHLGIACANPATRRMATSCCCWNRRRIFDLCLLRLCLLDYGST